ncbi:MAG: hypothetical protein IT195_03395 [Microthrixaceae bacterium]|nr:hypothetical protein [Microthrixaceae bacterium]
MAASIALPSPCASIIRFPRSKDGGLWEALAASTSQRSAAGSRPAEPTRLGRPISVATGSAEVIDMFAFRITTPSPEPPAAA